MYGAWHDGNTWFTYNMHTPFSIWFIGNRRCEISMATPIWLHKFVYIFVIYSYVRLGQSQARSHAYSPPHHRIYIVWLYRRALRPHRHKSCVHMEYVRNIIIAPRISRGRALCTLYSRRDLFDYYHMFYVRWSNESTPNKNNNKTNICTRECILAQN